jgi:hypothetical protein
MCNNPIREQGCTTKEDKFSERQGEKESSAIMRWTKRESSLKEPSHSTWDKLFYLGVDSLDIYGRFSLGTILAKSGNAGLLEACVRQNRNG